MMKSGAWFNGVDSYIETPPILFNSNDRKNWAVFAKIFITRDTGFYGRIYSERELNQSVILNFYFISSHEIEAVVRDKDGNSFAVNSEISPGEHIVGVVLKESVLSLYVDGEIVSQQIVTLSDFTNISKGNIGRQVALQNNYFKGIVSELYFYSGKIPDELLEDVIHGKFRDSNLAYFDFRCGVSTDFSGHQNHGVPHNIRYVGVHTRSGAYFNGKNGYVVIPQPVINGTGDYTVLLELYNIVPKIPYSGIFRHGYDLYVYRQQNKLKGEYRQSDGVWKVTLSKYEDGWWGWRKNGSLLEMLREGRKVSSVALTINVPYEGDSRKVGATASVAIARGIVKRVLIYKRALSDNEIVGVFTKSIVPPDLSLFYDFTLGTIKDLSGNNHDGVIHGDVRFIGL